MTIPVVAIVGPSDSGKTRVAAALVQALVERGHRVAAVKHSPHGHQVDRPGTDSARLFEAGAARVLLSSPGQVISFQRREDDAPLEQIVSSLGPSYDLVIAEGYKESAVPKVLVLGKEPLPSRPRNVIAVVSGEKVAGDAPCYAFGELDGLARQIQDRFLSRARRTQAISLVVDGVPIPLASFPSRALAGVIRGFLKALRNVPPNPRMVQLVLDVERDAAGTDVAAPNP